MVDMGGSYSDLGQFHCLSTQGDYSLKNGLCDAPAGLLVFDPHQSRLNCCSHQGARGADDGFFLPLHAQLEPSTSADHA